MKITIVSDVCYPTVCDGVASILTNTIRELLTLGHQIQLVVPAGSEMAGVELVLLKAFHVSKTDHQMFPVPSLRMFRAVKTFAPDIILFMDPRFLALQAIWFFRVVFGKSRLVATFNTDNMQFLKILYGVPLFASRLLHRIIFNRFSKILSVSTYCRSLLTDAGVRAHGGIWSGGVDARLFSPAKRNEAFREQFLKGDEDTIALYVGRISREKGISRLVPLFHVAREKRVRWLIVGDGDDREELQRQSQGCPVSFVGPKYGESLAEAYASSDLFVFPSQVDTFGLVVLEAMASGLPVIAYDHGALPQIISNGVDGVVIPCNEHALLETHNEWLSDKEKFKHLGANARASIKSSWDWPNCTKQLLDQIQSRPCKG